MSSDTESTVPQSEKPPETPEPEMHWILAAITRRWPAMKKFVVHFAFLAVGALAVLFLYEKFIIPGKDANLAQKDETIRTVSEERDAANRENDKLRRDNEWLKNYRSKETMPLKQSALLLARQIHEYIKDWKDTDDPGKKESNIQKYLQRFGLRASIMRDDLDQNGQHSDAFDKVMYNFSFNYEDVRTIADQIEKLANNLPDQSNP